MFERLHRSLFHWCRLVGSASDGARSIEHEGVVAAVVPAAAERAVMNAVVYESPRALAGAYEELKRAYASIGANWTVWVPPGDDVAKGFLGNQGHFLDAEPMGMGRSLSEPPERPPAGALEDWTADGALADVGRINDRAYPWGTDSFSRGVARLPDGAARIYVASVGGEPAACALIVDHEGNAEVELVAVVPEARGRGLSFKLLSCALADAAERGNETTTLVATRLGQPVYGRLGFEDLGRIEMWERRAG